MEQTEELLKAIESANNGIWMPLVTIVAVFSLVIVLLLYIWNTTQKTNDKRHTDNERIIKGITKTSNTMSLLLVKIETNQENQQKEIDHLLDKS
jgi:hypothetical protein